jgi:hypothetical protein
MPQQAKVGLILIVVALLLLMYLLHINLPQ